MITYRTSATCYEGILFGYALYKTATNNTHLLKQRRMSLFDLLLRDNIIYFFGYATQVWFPLIMVHA